jgi:hypothetical protein
MGSSAFLSQKLVKDLNFEIGTVMIKTVFRIRIRIRINLSCWIWIWIQEGKNYPQKKSRIFMFLSTGTGCYLLRAEGFSCSLGVLFGGLGISKLQFLIKKIEIKFPAIIFFSILGHQTLDPDPQLE